MSWIFGRGNAVWSSDTWQVGRTSKGEVVMNRLYVGLAAVLVVGGAAALVGQAWVLGAILLILGVLCLGVEIRARRPSVRVVMDGPSAPHEVAKAQALQNFKATDIRYNGGYSSF
jgi:hypothetical protein